MSGAIAIQLAVVALGAIALAVIVRRLRRRLPRRGVSAFDAALADAVESAPQIEELASIHRAIDGARLSSFEVEARLRPLLHDMAAFLLWERRGIELARQPGPAAQVLGPETFTFLCEVRRAGRVSRRGPGLSLAALERIVRALESI